MTPAALAALIAERLPDNAQNRITPADLRSVCTALAEASAAPDAPTLGSAAPARAARPRAAHRLYLFHHFT
jgi:hypothetical protein